MMSISSIKKILLAGTALVAVAAFGVQAQAATVTVSTTGTTTLASDPAATPAVTFTADGTAVDPDGSDYLVTAGDTVTNTSGTDNEGTLTLAGTSGTQTVAGAVGGAGAALKAVNAGAAGGTSIFSGAVTAQTLTVSGTGTVDLNAAGANTIGTLNYAGDGTVSLATAGTLTGNITTSATNTGTLTAAGTETITGTVGASGKLLKAVNIGAGAAGITGDVYATTVTVTGSNTVAFGGNVNATTFDFGATTGTAQIASGKNLTATNITGSAAATLDLVGGTQTVTGAIDDTALIITAGAANASTTFASAITNAGTITGGTGSMTFDGNVTTSGAITAANTTDIKTVTITDGGAFTLGAGQTLKATATGAAAGVGTNGNIAAGANLVTIDPTATVSFNTSGVSIPTGTTLFTLVSSANAGSVGALNAGKLIVNGVTDTAAGTTAFTAGLVSYQQVVNGDNFEIQATRSATLAGVSGTTSNDAAVYTALTAAGTTHGAELTTANTNLTSAGTGAAVHNVLESVAPTVDGGAQMAALNVVSDTEDITANRMLALRDGDTSSGVAAGASANGTSMWVQGYGQHAHQGTRDGIEGFSGNTWGGTVGADTSAFADNATVGFALNYGHSKIDSDNANTTTTALDNYGLTLYSNYDLGDRMFVLGQAGYAYNKINADRHNVGGAGGPTASGNTHSDQWTARADLGRDYPLGAGLILTPDISADYTYLNTKGYTETGAGAADLTVSGDTVNVLNLGVGGTASWKIKDYDDNVYKPSLHAGYAYEALNDKISETSSFAGDPGVNFVTTGATPQRNIYDVGARLVYSTPANWDLSATYDFQGKQGFTAHTGELRATAHF